MRLWTYHTPDFSLTSGRVNHSQSDYYRTVPGVPEAYAELWRRLGTDQIVWCYAQDGEQAATTTPHVEWLLEIPNVLAFVDGIVWNRILGIRCQVPKTLRYAWKNKSIVRFPHNASERHGFIERQTDAFWTMSPPGGDWWNSLIIESSDCETVQVIIKHPVPESCVVAKTPFVEKRSRS